MAETRHTPGPWRYTLARWVNDPPSPVVGYAVYADAKRKAPDGSDVALAAGNTGSQWAFSAFYSPSEIEANARLIAAAPLMLEALKAVCAPFEGFDDAPLYVQKARAALASATGEAS